MMRGRPNRPLRSHNRDTIPPEAAKPPTTTRTSARTSARIGALTQEDGNATVLVPVDLSTVAESSEKTSVRVGRRYQVDFLPDPERGEGSSPPEDRGDVLVEVTTAGMEAEAAAAKAWMVRQFGSAEAAMHALSGVRKGERDSPEPEVVEQVTGKRMRLKTSRAEEYLEARQRVKQKPTPRASSSSAGEESPPAPEAVQSTQPAQPKKPKAKATAGHKSAPKPQLPPIAEHSTVERPKKDGAAAGEMSPESSARALIKMAARNERKRFLEEAQPRPTQPSRPAAKPKLPSSLEADAKLLSLVPLYDPLEVAAASAERKEQMLWNIVATPQMMAAFSKSVAQQIAAERAAAAAAPSPMSVVSESVEINGRACDEGHTVHEHEGAPHPSKGEQSPLEDGQSYRWDRLAAVREAALVVLERSSSPEPLHHVLSSGARSVE